MVVPLSNSIYNSADLRSLRGEIKARGTQIFYLAGSVKPEHALRGVLASVDFSPSEAEPRESPTLLCAIFNSDHCKVTEGFVPIRRSIGGPERRCKQKLPTSVLVFALWTSKREPSLGRLLQNSQAENLSQAWLGLKHGVASVHTSGDKC